MSAMDELRISLANIDRVFASARGLGPDRSVLAVEHSAPNVVSLEAARARRKAMQERPL
jgi:hypothetical protein